jgi:chorismate mutase
MDEISKLRSEIDQIQIELAELFRRRLKTSKRIWEIKEASALNFIDPERELEIKNQISKLSQEMPGEVNEAEKKALRNFLQMSLEESKTCLKAQFK